MAGPDEPWFRPRPGGWYPVSCQGWLVTLIAIGLIFLEVGWAVTHKAEVGFGFGLLVLGTAVVVAFGLAWIVIDKSPPPY